VSALSIRIQSQALVELQAKAAKVGRQADVALAAARGAADRTRRHLYNLDERSPRSHFYSAAAKSIEEPRIEGQGASFVITKVGLAQRYFGGHIEAGKGASSAGGALTKYLAIPARDETENKTPGEFDDLIFVPRGNGKAMLVQALQTSIVGKRGQTLKHPERRSDQNTTGGLVMFWLVSAVDQEPDPTVLPADEDLSEAARYHGEQYLARLLETQPGPGNGGAN
jgi:hypothetical protein